MQLPKRLTSGDLSAEMGSAPGFWWEDADFCKSYHVVGHIQMPVDNEERGREIATCRLSGSLAHVWPKVVALYT